MTSSQIKQAIMSGVRITKRRESSPLQHLQQIEPSLSLALVFTPCYHPGAEKSHYLIQESLDAPQPLGLNITK